MCCWCVTKYQHIVDLIKYCGLITAKGEKMSLEHAQVTFHQYTKANKWHPGASRATTATFLVPGRLIDLIEKVRWLRNDLYKLNEHNKQAKP